MRYNFVCALANYLKDKDAALEMLGAAFEKTPRVIKLANTKSITMTLFASAHSQAR